VSTALRAFLMLRHPTAEWEINVFHSLEDLVRAWDNRAEREATAVLHCGFVRRTARSFEAIAVEHPGQVLLTAGGRHALPGSFRTTEFAVGFVDEEPVYLGLEGWGYSVAAPIEPAKFDLPSFVGWVGDYVRAESGDAAALLEAKIFDEASYGEFEDCLSQDLRERLGRFRLNALVHGQDQDPCIIAKHAPPWAADLELESFGLTVRLGNVFVRQGIRTIADLAGYTIDDLFALQNFGRRSARDLVDTLTRAMNAGVQTKEAVVQALIEKPLLTLVDQTLSRLTDRQQDILRRRMGWNAQPETLADIGEGYGITRERVRQIEDKTVKQIVREEYWDDLLAEKLAAMLVDRDYPLPVMGAEALDSWFEGFGSRAPTIRYLLANMCNSRVSIVTVEGIDYLSFMNPDTWLELVTSGRQLLQGAVDQNWSRAHCRHLVTGLLPDNSREFATVLWEKSSHLCHFAGDSDNDVLVAYGRGAEHIVEAVLEQSDRPLHFSEIAVLASERAGRAIDERRVHSAAAEVGLVLGRGTYGLARHLGLETNVLMTLAEEASALVTEGPPGRQWHASELAAALVDTDIALGVCPDKYVVNAALTLYGSLKPLGRLVWINSGASNSGARVDLRQAMVKTLDHAGVPLSSAELYQRLVAIRGINDGWVIAASDPVIRLGSGLWGLNDRDLPIKRSEQPALLQSIVAILEKRNAGLHTSELSEHLPADLSPRTFLGLASLDPRLQVSWGQYIFLKVWGDPRRQSISAACLEVLRCVGPLQFDELYMAVSDQVGRRFARTDLSSTLQSIEARMDASNRWSLAEEEQWSSHEAA